MKVNHISELLFHDSGSEWSDSEDAGNDEIDGCKDSGTSVLVIVGNDKVNYWNEACDVQLEKQVNLESIPAFSGEQSVKGF
jgi:hypothetical protein